MSKFYPLRLIITIVLSVIPAASFPLHEIKITDQIKKGMGGEDVLLPTPLTRPDGQVVKISIAKVLFLKSLGFVVAISGYIFFIVLLPFSRKPKEYHTEKPPVLGRIFVSSKTLKYDKN